MNNFTDKNIARKKAKAEALDSGASHSQLKAARQLRRALGGAFTQLDAEGYNFAILGTMGEKRQTKGSKN